MSIKNLFFSSYWFSQPGAAESWVRGVWIGLLLALVLVGIILLFVRRYQQAKALRLVYSRFSTCLIVMGMLGLMWFYFRQEQVLLLGWRFWVIPWFVVLAIWLAKIIRYVVKRLPQIEIENREREQREKYLPR